MNRKDRIAHVLAVIDSLPQGYSGMPRMAPEVRQCNPSCQHYHPGKKYGPSTCTHTRANTLQAHASDSCKYDLPPR